MTMNQKRVSNLKDIISNTVLSIQKYKSNCDIQIDLCELHGLNYQSSLAYTAYIPNLRKEIARGGRYLAYDAYSSNPRTATGFSLDIKDLLDILLQKRPYNA